MLITGYTCVLVESRSANIRLKKCFDVTENTIYNIIQLFMCVAYCFIRDMTLAFMMHTTNVAFVRSIKQGGPKGTGVIIDQLHCTIDTLSAFHSLFLVCFVWGVISFLICVMCVNKKKKVLFTVTLMLIKVMPQALFLDKSCRH